MIENPFAEGENRIIRPPATALVIFGASGDLTHRKLVPALYNLAVDGYLPTGCIVIGASRSKFSDQEFRDSLKESVRKHSRRELDKKVWDKFAEQIFYQPLDANSAADFKNLKARLESLSKQTAQHYNYLYYLATSPDFFGPVAEQLGAAGLVEPYRGGARTTSLVVEKPFGEDLPSARNLNSKLRRSFDEHQIFRIDHYLGKETVQNILVFRFANGIFEPLWNQKYIDHIQVSVCETVGVESRAGYFDRTGILRDIVQNHLLQMLALLCIEPPTSLSDADAIRSEKVKVLSSIKRLAPADVFSQTVRAQYRAGFIDGQSVPGYLDEKGVAPHSATETFVGLRLEIDNWRWAGVPIYIRAGKRLPKRITEITVHFKRPPGSLFKGRQINELDANVMSIKVQPNEGISLTINSKPPGPRMRVGGVEMDFSYGRSFGIASPEAYERLLLDAMKGDATLFTRDDEIEEAWDLLAPIMAAWNSQNPPPVYEYSAGTWGPPEADLLMANVGHHWRRL